MDSRNSPNATRFDDFAISYDHALAMGLSATGEDRDFFARGRIEVLRKHLGRMQFQPHHAMEFGCGTGSNLPLLLEMTGAKSVLGLDVSEKSIEMARGSLNSSAMTFAHPDRYRPEARIDLAFCNGVFHHIDPAMRLSVVKYVLECLRPGGLFALWENNPWNPGTRLVMSRIPFDKDAITLTPSEGRRMLTAGGFRIVSSDYAFLFPRALRWLRPLETPLCRLPIGGQYQLLAIKPE